MRPALRPVVRAVVNGLVGASAVGCANIWGFEDAVPIRIVDAEPAEASACTCVAAAPDGWEGPFELFEGAWSATATPPSCGGAFLPTPAFTGFGLAPDVPPATCTCSCEPPATTCSAPVATLYSDNNCSRPCATVTLANACTALASTACGGGGPGKVGGGASATIAAPVASGGGTCTPHGVVTVGPPAWTTSARLCAPAPASVPPSCPGGDVCAPTPEVGFEAGTYCIVRAEATSCPAQTYTAPRTYYASALDTRGCGACTCDAPTGVSCAQVNISTFTDPACTSPSVRTSPPSACLVAAGALFAGTSTQGSCTPHVPAPTGTFAPAGETTVCCTP